MAVLILSKGTSMQIVLGPVLTRKGGYAFDAPIRGDHAEHGEELDCSRKSDGSLGRPGPGKCRPLGVGAVELLGVAEHGLATGLSRRKMNRFRQPIRGVDQLRSLEGDREFADSPLEQRRFELMVPPRNGTARKTLPDCTSNDGEAVLPLQERPQFFKPWRQRLTSSMSAMAASTPSLFERPE
jgi:hypothetical protein